MYLVDMRPYLKPDVHFCTAAVSPTDSTTQAKIDPSEWHESWCHSLLQSFSDIYKEPKGVAPVSPNDFRIRLDPMAREPHRPPYRFTPTEKKLFEEKIRSLIEKGWVQESQSRFASPVCLFLRPMDQCECALTIGP